MTNRQNRLDKNKTLMRKMVGAFATGDISDVDFFVSQGYLDHQGLGGNKIHGAEGFKKVVTAARKNGINSQVHIEDMIAENDKVVVRLRWQGVDSSGKVISRETIDIVRFENDQAVEHWGAEV